MTYKQIEASREMRLWIGQVIIPAAAAAVAIASNPNTRDYISKKYNNVKSRMRSLYYQKKFEGRKRPKGPGKLGLFSFTQNSQGLL